MAKKIIKKSTAKKVPVKKAAKKAVRKTVKKAAPKKAAKKTAPKKVTSRASVTNAKTSAPKKAAKKSAPKKVTAKKASPKKATLATSTGSVTTAAKNKKVSAPVEPKTNVINPYLTFNGTCEEAFNFYRAIFGGDFTYVGRFKEMPPMEGYPPVSEEVGNLIMHVSLPISKETVLMGSDSSEEFGKANVVGNNFGISINATSEQEADRLYNLLAENGQQTMPMSKTFWGSYWGMLTDRYDINWMVSFGQ